MLQNLHPRQVPVTSFVIEGKLVGPWVDGTGEMLA